MATVATPEPVAPAVRFAAEEPLYEVVNGQREDLPPMSAYASWSGSRIAFRLSPFVEGMALGTVVTETLFVLDPTNDVRRRPDVAFVSAEKWPLGRDIPEIGDWEVIPDLAVEVVSPTELFHKVVDKMKEYFHYGVKQVWIVLPHQKQIYIYDSPTGVRIVAPPQELEGGPLLPGFTMSLNSVFRSESQPQSAPA